MSSSCSFAFDVHQTGHFRKFHNCFVIGTVHILHFRRDLVVYSRPGIQYVWKQRKTVWESGVQGTSNQLLAVWCRHVLGNTHFINISGNILHFSLDFQSREIMVLVTHPGKLT